MNNFLSLLKVNILIFFGSLKKKKKGKYVGGVLAILFFVVFFGGSMSFQAVMNAYNLVGQYNLPRYAVFMGLATSFAISLLFGLMRATTASTAKDAELLLSMPLRKSTVVLSKIATQYVFDAPILIIMLLPTIIATFAFGGLSVPGLLRGILLVFLIPVLSLTISMLFGYFFSFIRERVPAGNIILTAMTMMLLLGYIVWNMQMSTIYMSVALSGAEQAKEMIEKVLPIKHMTYFVTDGGWTNTVGTLITIFAPFFFAVVLFASRYGRGTYQRKSKNRVLSFRTRSLRKSLLIVEFKKYFSSALYVFNTAFGAVMLAAATVAVLVMGKDKIISLFAADGDFPVNISTLQIGGIIAIVACFCAAMTVTTPATISFEGKRFWILRSLPIRTGEILLTKILMSVLMFVPVQLICSFAIAVRLGISPSAAVAFALLPATLNLAVSGAGLIINLLMPKMDWRSEAEIIKQSMSVMLSVLIGFGLTAVPIILYFSVFMRFGGAIAAAYSCAALFLLVFAAEIFILMIPGRKMFERLAA
ncbi:MAG: hypothetical protein JW780_00445 [Clostridiales bacterium]|nr:hypothetical protein [Clostridiales bacterium]